MDHLCTPGNICTVETLGMARQAIAQKFNSVFEGIGRIKDIKNDKELFVQFNIKETAAPVAQRP